MPPPPPINPAVRIGHIHLKVADLDLALAFYHGVLGFEITQRFGPRAAFLSAAVRANHAEFFDRPTPEPFRSFSPTIGRLVTYLLAAHEPYHLGQLMQWRRAAGLAK